MVGSLIVVVVYSLVRVVDRRLEADGQSDVVSPFLVPADRSGPLEVVHLFGLVGCTAGHVRLAVADLDPAGPVDRMDLVGAVVPAGLTDPVPADFVGPGGIAVLFVPGLAGVGLVAVEVHSRYAIHGFVGPVWLSGVLVCLPVGSVDFGGIVGLFRPGGVLCSVEIDVSYIVS